MIFCGCRGDSRIARRRKAAVFRCRWHRRAVREAGPYGFYGTLLVFESGRRGQCRPPYIWISRLQPQFHYTNLTRLPTRTMYDSLAPGPAQIKNHRRQPGRDPTCFTRLSISTMSDSMAPGPAKIKTHRRQPGPDPTSSARLSTSNMSDSMAPGPAG